MHCFKEPEAEQSQGETWRQKIKGSKDQKSWSITARSMIKRHRPQNMQSIFVDFQRFPSCLASQLIYCPIYSIIKSGSVFRLSSSEMCPLSHSTTLTEMTTVLMLDCSQPTDTQQPGNNLEREKFEVPPPWLNHLG